MRTRPAIAARLNEHRQGLKVKPKEGDDPKKVRRHGKLRAP
jgi:hypothetical protein